MSQLLYTEFTPPTRDALQAPCSATTLSKQILPAAAAAACLDPRGDGDGVDLALPAAATAHHRGYDVASISKAIASLILSDHPLPSPARPDGILFSASSAADNGSGRAASASSSASITYARLVSIGRLVGVGSHGPVFEGLAETLRPDALLSPAEKAFASASAATVSAVAVKAAVLRFPPPSREVGKGAAAGQRTGFTPLPTEGKVGGDSPRGHASDLLGSTGSGSGSHPPSTPPASPSPTHSTLSMSDKSTIGTLVEQLPTLHHANLVSLMVHMSPGRLSCRGSFIRLHMLRE